MTDGPRAVLVTGGGTGIGAAVARLLAGAGDEVAILGRRPEVLASVAASTGAFDVVCDVSDAGQVETTVAARGGGPIDPNAGGEGARSGGGAGRTPPGRPSPSAPRRSWRRTVPGCRSSTWAPSTSSGRRRRRPRLPGRGQGRRSAGGAAASPRSRPRGWPPPGRVSCRAARH